MTDMTTGPVRRHLFTYALPLIAGNFLQLTYNAVDSILVGKGAGLDALSAVSVSNPVSALLVLFVSGLGIGGSVWISRFFGAGDKEKVKRSFSTMMISGTVLSFIVLFFGLLFSQQILTLMKVPDEIMDLSLVYLRLLFVGNLFTFQYNLLSQALRAIGDSKAPLKFITVSSLMNACLDAVFIFGFHLSVFGAALATVLSEAASAILCAIYIYRKVPVLSLHRKDWCFDRVLFNGISSSGILTALQQSCQPIGKLCIQSVINTQGIDVIAAFNAACRIDDYGRIPTQTNAAGIMTCVSQNLGAGKKDRVRESLKQGLFLILIYCPFAAAAMFLFRRPLLTLFAPNDGGEEMIQIGVSYLAVKAFMIVFPAFTNSIQGFFRGLNHMTITLVSTILQISLRTLFVFLLVPKIGIIGEAWASAIGWAAMIVYEYGYYLLRVRKKLL